MNDNLNAVIQEVISWNGLCGMDRDCLSPMSLELIRTEGMFDHFIERLHDPDYNVKRAVIYILGILGDPRAIEHLEKYIYCVHLDEEVADSLIKIGPESSDIIRRIISEDNIPDDVQRIMVDALEGVRYEWVYDLLSGILKSGGPDARYLAMRGLYMTGNPNACDDAESAVKHDTNTRVRVYALRILYEFGISDPVINALSDPASIIRTQAANYVEDLDNPDAVSSLCRATDVETDDTVLENMLKSLGRIMSPDAIDTFIKAMGHDNEDVRINAVRGLVNLRDDSLEALSMALRCSDPYIRDCAADAIVRIGSDAAITILLTATKDSDPRVRRRAALSLRYTNDPRKTDALKAITNDPEVRVRNAAKSVLGEKRLG